MPVRVWTQEEFERACSLRRQGWGYKRIGLELGYTRDQVRRKFDREGMRRSEDGVVHPVTRVVVPEDVLADRARRLDAPRSLGQLLMGDPLLEDSALGKR